ncbi:MAG TPA: hypothetical protein VK066_11225 [Chloroflexota bacterium]|nr:hypothetical protein [Chloroflexota bacterium]
MRVMIYTRGGDDGGDKCDPARLVAHIEVRGAHRAIRMYEAGVRRYMQEMEHAPWVRPGFFGNPADPADVKQTSTRLERQLWEQFNEGTCEFVAGGNFGGTCVDALTSYPAWSERALAKHVRDLYLWDLYGQLTESSLSQVLRRLPLLGRLLRY